MKLPSNYTEAQVLEIFDRVARKLCFKFRFGINSVEDIKQEAMVYAIQALEKYDERRPLENFLYIHLRNRLYNFKRNNYFRLELPCVRCPVKAFLPPDGCKAFKDRQDCELYKGWAARNTVRKNLTNVLEYGQISIGEKNLGYGDDSLSKINTKEILTLIDKELPIAMRKNYLKRMAGEKLSKKDAQELEETIIRIIKISGHEI